MFTNTISFYCLMTIFIDSSGLPSLHNSYKKAPFIRGFSIINIYTVKVGKLERLSKTKITKTGAVKK